MPVEHLINTKEFAKLKISHPTNARPDIIGQQIHVDV